MEPWLPVLAGTFLLLLLALRLRGPRNRTDLRGPPVRKRRRITAAEAARLGALVKDADGARALRLIRRAGYDEGEARKLVALVARIEALCVVTDAPPDAGWTEQERGADGLSYGRAFDYNPTLHDWGHHDKR